MPFDWPAMKNKSATRPGQTRALGRIGERLERHWTQRAAGRLRREDQMTSIVLPCRYGKSDVMRLTAAMTRALDLAITTLAVSPAVSLREQLGDLRRWNRMIERYGIPVTPGITTIREPKVRFNGNGEVFVSVTTQLVNSSLNLFRDWVESETNKGRLVVVAIDECHTSSERNQWGKIADKLAEVGAHVVLFTATPERDDHQVIPGFGWKIVDERDITIYRSLPHEQPDMIKIQQCDGVSRKLLLEANVEVSFAEAWDEDPSCICKASRTTFDLQLDDGRWLSTLKDKQEIRMFLGRALRTQAAVEIAVKRLIDRLRERRAAGQRFQAIVYCGADIERGRGSEKIEDKHLKMVRDELARQWPQEWPPPRIVMATSSEDSEGADAINEFAGDEDQPGSADVLLLKQMAGMGTDFPWVKIVLDLSPTRTYAAVVQRWFRGATPCAGVYTWDLITPDDQITQEYFDRIVTQQGGEASVSDLSVVREWVQKRDDGATQVAGVKGGDDGRFSDSEGRSAAGDLLAEVGRLIAVFPELLDRFSHAEIAERWLVAEGERATDTESAAVVVDTSIEASALRRKINERTKEALTLYRVQHGRPAYDRETYGRDMDDVYGWIKKDANWPMGKKLSEIDDLPKLERLLEVAERYVKQWGGNGNQG